jgi:peptidoglycan/LPS O-acetylase OafA/YrhL
MISHTMAAYPWGRAVLRETGWFGYLGVRCFFVLSGLLITTILLRELETRGRISLPRFYLRRSLRILPPFWVFLACIAVLAAFGGVVLPRNDLLYSVTFVLNYRSSMARSHWLGHLWSLCVEEQFYLLWPLVLVLFGRRRALWAVVGAVLVVPWIRYFTRFWTNDDGIKWEFQTVCDSLATGCLLAMVRERIYQWAPYRWLVKNGIAVGLLVCVALFLQVYMVGRPRLKYLIGFSYLNITIAIAIDYLARYPRSPAGRLLTWKPIVMVGTISYSLYLWQQPFLNPQPASLLATFPVNWMLALLAGWCSYRFVEKPFTEFRREIEGRGRVAWLDGSLWRLIRRPGRLPRAVKPVSPKTEPLPNRESPVQQVMPPPSPDTGRPEK